MTGTNPPASPRLRLSAGGIWGVLLAVASGAPWFAACAASMAGDSHMLPESAIYTYAPRFSLNYDITTMDGRPPQRVEFFITRDMGRTWSHYGEDERRASSMPISVEGEGIYGFWSVATDSRGNRESPPRAGVRPLLVVVVDRTPPTARWLEPTAPTITGPDTVRFAWDSEDQHYGPGPVTIEVSGDDGRSWSVLGAELGDSAQAAGLPASGEYTWTPVSHLGSPLRFRLVCRDRAGNTAIEPCATRVLVDTTPPVVRIVGPALANHTEIQLQYDARDDGGSGLMEVAIYETRDEGRSWRKIATDLEPDRTGQLLAIRAGAGRMGLMAVARDFQGNTSPLPYSGMAPPHWLVVDTTPPMVRLDESFIGFDGTVPAGAMRRVAWTATDDDELRLNSAAIEISLDGGSSWRAEREGLGAASGAWEAAFPRQGVPAAQLRVTVTDRAGNAGSATSRVFSIQDSAVAIREVTPGVEPGYPPITVPPPAAGTTDEYAYGSVFEVEPIQPTRDATRLAVGPAPINPVGPQDRDAAGIGDNVWPTNISDPAPPLPAQPWDSNPFGYDWLSESTEWTPAPIAVQPPAVAAPAAPWAHSGLERLFRQANSQDSAPGALAEVNRMLDFESPTVEHYLVQGWAYVNLPDASGGTDNLHLAAQSANRALNLDPNNPMARHLAAEITFLLGVGFYDGIQRMPLHSFTMDAGQWAIFRETADYRDDFLRGSRVYMNGLTAEFPSDKTYMALLGDIRLFEARALQQNRLIEEVMKRGPLTQAQLAAMEAEMERMVEAAFFDASPIYEEAVELWIRALAMPPANDYASAVAIGQIYASQNAYRDFEKAIPYFRLALAATDMADAGKYLAHYGLGMSLFWFDPHTQARAARDHLQRALQTMPATHPRRSEIEDLLTLIQRSNP